MPVNFYLCLVILAVIMGCRARNFSHRTPLYIGGLMPLMNGTFQPGHIALTACKQAIEDINNRSDVLPGYEIIMEWADTERAIPSALNRLYEFIYKPPVKVAIFGPVLSSVASLLAEVMGNWNIVEMSLGASTPVLSDREKYPHIYRMVTSSASFGTAYAQIIKQFGWEKVAILYHAGEPHQARMTAVNDEALVSNFSITIAESFLDDPYESLSRLKGKDARIIATSFYEATAREVFCAAFKLGLYGPNYVWMIPGYFSDNWQEVADGVNCTAEQLKTATEGYLAVTFSVFERNKEITSCGKSPYEFQQLIEDAVGFPISRTDAGLGAWGYDGLWALATAMQEAETVLKRKLDTYQYGDEQYARVVGDRILNLEFIGLSGPVKFSKTGYRLSNLQIQQNVGGEEIDVGTFDNIKRMLDWSIPVDNLWYYSGGHPPYESDITVTITNLQATPLPIVVGMSALASLGIILALMFLGFNFWKRNHKQIKMSSPNINKIIACGIILAYVCVMLLGIDRSMVDDDSLVAICRTRSWLLVLAFTLAFGGMFTKTWRVYSIVISNKTKRKVIKDRYLFGIIAVLLLVDFAILIPWQIVDPIHIEEVRTDVPQTKNDLANYRRYELLHVNCTSENNNIWIMAMLVYKAFVVVFGAFLAWSTRNINVPGLNDSYYVGLSIYNTVICCVVAVPLSLLSLSSIGVTFALVSSFLLFCITTSLCMMFFPKVNAVYRKNKVGENAVTGLIIGTTHKSVSMGHHTPDVDRSRPNLPTISSNVKPSAVTE